MRTYLLIVLFVFSGLNLASRVEFSASYFDIVKLCCVAAEEENTEKKINESHPEDDERNLHSDTYPSLLFFKKPCNYFSGFNSYIETNMANRPFTPPDVI